MAGTWVYAHHLPYLGISDATRDRRSYEGETEETQVGRTWEWGYGDITEMWEITDITRNGYITLTRNVRRHGMWEETGETRRIRGRKNLPLTLVSIGPSDPRWAAVQKKYGESFGYAA